MKFKHLTEHFGDDEHIAAALNRSASCIAKWKSNSNKTPPIPIPLQAQFAIQGMTNGLLKADKPKKVKS